VGCRCGVLARVGAGDRVLDDTVELGHDGSLSLESERGPESQGRSNLEVDAMKPTYWLREQFTVLGLVWLPQRPHNVPRLPGGASVGFRNSIGTVLRLSFSAIHQHRNTAVVCPWLN
jgi:hypothetical protein